MAEIDNINDRKILILLSHKKRKSCCDKYRIKWLECLYPDHKNHEQHFISELLDSGHLEHTCLKDGGKDEFNRPLRSEFSEPYTTKSGICALRNELFSSESATRNKAKWDRKLEWVYKILAILGGLLGIINMIWLFNR